MISVIHNETLKAVEIHLDDRGVDLLMQRLQELKRNEDHVHIHATNDDRGLSLESPYHEKVIFDELILNLPPSDAWELAQQRT